MPMRQWPKPRPALAAGWNFRTAHHNTHLSMSLKKIGFVDRDAIPRGVAGSVARAP